MTRKQLWLAIFVLLVAALVAATARWIVWPKTDAAPEHADAVVVLGGGGSERLDEGLKLVDEGVAQVLVISDGNRPGWERANELCAKGDPGSRSSASSRSRTARRARPRESPSWRASGGGRTSWS